MTSNSPEAEQDADSSHGGPGRPHTRRDLLQQPGVRHRLPPAHRHRGRRLHRRRRGSLQVLGGGQHQGAGAQEPPRGGARTAVRPRWTDCVRLGGDVLCIALYTASADKSIRAFDTLGNPTWAEMRAHEHPVNRLHELSTNVFASGDDQGCIKIWDTRQHRCLSEFKEHTVRLRKVDYDKPCLIYCADGEIGGLQDYISGFATNPAQDHLLATSGDGRLSAYDLRKNVLAGKSDELDDELLSVAVIKNGRKIVCGSQDGVLVIFSWGTWGDMSDRFPGHPESVEALLKVDEDTVLTGSSDGIVRVVQLHPNKLLGLIGDHEDFPVENLKFSHDKKIIGSVSHTNKVHFWDVGYLFDEDDGEDEDAANDEEEKAPAGLSMDTEMHDADSDSDSDDSDMGDAAGGRRAFPTANEQFFSDL
ncbi:hypothetical protein ON010_g17358 [Phytophthora cinnamomi]|nr:hypothetical protein ON010_g17358 [Phytophthora cinnamomi]